MVANKCSTWKRKGAKLEEILLIKICSPLYRLIIPIIDKQPYMLSVMTNPFDKVTNKCHPER